MSAIITADDVEVSQEVKNLLERAQKLKEAAKPLSLRKNWFDQSVLSALEDEASKLFDEAVSVRAAEIAKAL